MSLQATLHPGVGRKALGDVGQRHPQGQTGRGRGHGIAGVVLAGHLQADPGRAGRGLELQVRAVGQGLHLGPDLALLEAEGLGPMLRGELAPEAGAGVVAVVEGDTVGLEAGEDLALGPGHGLDAAEALQVGALGVVDQGHVGLGEAGEVGQLAGVVHAHLQHGVAMGRGQAQHHQGQADVVVEVALRG